MDRALVKKILPALLFPMLMASCRTPNVRVVDSRGMPVAGAQVIPYASSIYYRPAKTGKDGLAYVRRARWGENVRGVNVMKDGYQPKSAELGRRQVTVRLSR